MGRVFDALTRASIAQQNGASQTRSRTTEDSPRRAQVHHLRALPSAQQIEEEFLRSSSILTEPGNSAQNSASTAHTANVTDGSALSGGMTSRAAGATLDAAGATRAAISVAYDVNAARVEPHLVAITQPRSAYCEQFRSLRTRVLQAGEREGSCAFVVTSVGMGEGKTLTALNLAWLLAQNEGVRALVIDSDLRQPCAANYLAINAPVGLSEVLGGKLSLRDAIVRLDPAGLYLLPGGKPRDDVAEMLSGPTFAGIIAEARRMFDYIIIDAPPLGIFTDANLLMSRADSALLVVRAGKTRYSLVDNLLAELPREKVLGVVLNRAEDEIRASAYQDYYYRRNELEAGAGLVDVTQEAMAS